MMMRGWLVAAVAAGGVLLGAAEAMAQGTARPVHATHRFDDWTFEPILIGNEVQGFLTYVEPGSAVGNNVPMLWYHKNGDGTWQTFGWSVRDLAAGVRWVRDFYGDQELLKNSPKLCCFRDEGAELLAPKDMTDGLYTDDPMHSLIETADDPPAVMTLLEVIGWEAAPLLSTMAVTTVDSCTGGVSDQSAISVLLTESAHKMEVILIGAATTPVDCFSGCTGCVTNYDAPVPSANGSWTLTGQGTPASLPNDRFCYWDFPGTQRWWESGQKLTCAPCTASGVAEYIYRETTRVGRHESCTTPPAAPR